MKFFLPEEESVLLFECCQPCKPIKVSLLSTTTVEQIDVSLPFFTTNSEKTDDFGYDCRIYGPCDGLVCLYKRDTHNKDGRQSDTIAIWNPSTREIRDISKSKSSHSSSLLPRPESTNFGIGFDSKTKDYKVVCVTSYRTHYNHTKVEVYSLNSDSWREIDDATVPAPICPKPKSSTCIDGLYYWPATVLASGQGQHTILSFDMINEVFEIISLPPDSNHGFELNSVVNYYGSLAAICRYNEWSYPTTLWVMNKNNNKWEKHMELDLAGRVLGICRSGMILLEYPRLPDTELALYDCATNNFEYQARTKNPSGVQAVVYKGSLVSLSNKEEKEPAITMPNMNSSLQDFSTFTSHQLKHPSSSHNTQEESVLSFACCQPGRLIQASFLPSETFQQIEDVSIPLFSDFSTNLDFRIHGPCDGLVCLYKRDTNKGGRDTIAIWNPSTREIRDISKSSQDPLLPRPESMDFGIGFDSKNKDYKVVCVASYPDNHYKVEVYSLNLDSWREIKATVPAAICQKPKSSTYIDGFYYWPTILVSGEGQQAAHTILSFDMTHEVFESIPLPPDGNHESELDSVIDYNGSVAAICRTKEWSYPNTLWVMNKENKKWIKCLEIDLGGRVLGLCKRMVIMELPRDPGTMLVSYDCVKNKFRYQERNENPSGVQAVIYKGSLVSLSKKINN